MSIVKFEKVLYITNTIAEYRICFFNELSARIDTTFLITHPKMANKIYGSDGSNNSLKVINLDGNLIKNIRGLRKTIKNGEYTKIVLPPADSIPEIIEGYVSLHYAKKTKADIFTWTEKWEPEKKYQPLFKRFKNLIQRIAYGHFARNATRCISFGKKSKEYIHQVGAQETKIRTAHMTSVPPVDMNLFSIREKHQISEDKKIIFCLARMIPRKGIEVLIDAIADLNKKHNDCVLLLGGDGPLKESLISKTRALGLKNIVFAGRIAPEERSTYYAQSNIFVLPSRIVDGIIEGWGLPVNEALFCGVPVVATTAVGSAYDMLNGKNGIMVEQNNSYEMAAGIEKYVYYSDQNDIKTEIDKTNDIYSINNMVEGFINALMR